MKAIIGMDKNSMSDIGGKIYHKMKQEAEVKAKNEGKKEYLNTAFDLVYLAGCALNGIIPDTERVRTMDLPLLYQMAEKHLLTGITAMALESAGVKNNDFTQAKGKAIRKAVLFDMERSAILQQFETAGIWYMLLKGSVLKNLYPAIGMRQMSDNDILFDGSRDEEVRRIMEKRGFITRIFGKFDHDSYEKPPVLRFEMHRGLFEPWHGELFRYYQDVEKRLIPGDGFERHFTPEDFYIYQTAHEYKHYSVGGVGLRSLLDTCLYCRQYTDLLDWQYIQGELKKLGIADFEEQSRRLALHLFDGAELSEADQQMFEYMITSGTFGTKDHVIRNTMKKNGWGRLQYMWNRLKVPVSRNDPFYEAYARTYPMFYKHKILLTALPFYRLGKAVKNRRFRGEWRLIRKNDTE